MKEEVFGHDCLKNQMYLTYSVGSDSTILFFFFSVMCWPLLYQKIFEVKALILIRLGWPFTNLSSLNPDAGNGCPAPVVQVYVIMKIAVLRSLTADDPHR